MYQFKEHTISKHYENFADIDHNAAAVVVSILHNDSGCSGTTGTANALHDITSCCVGMILQSNVIATLVICTCECAYFRNSVLLWLYLSVINLKISSKITLYSRLCVSTTVLYD